MENKRKLTKVGSILSIIAWSLNILALIVTGIFVLFVIATLNELGSEDLTSLYSNLISLVVSFVISIFLIVYSAKAIKLSNVDLETYMTKKSTILFVAIVNLLNAFYSVIEISKSAKSLTDTIVIITFILTILVCVLLLVSGIMILVDYFKANNKLKTLQTTSQNEVNEENSEQKPEEETIEEKLEKFNKMKEDGLISEEEYEKLKSDLLK